MKLNVDGVSKIHNKRAGAGCVIRNYLGRWQVGAARKLGHCSALLAEVWAILLELELAWDKGYREVTLETDWQTAKYKALIDSCRSLLQRDWNVELLHIYREANSAVDGVTNWAICQSSRLLHLLADQQGISYPRWVHIM